jgi:hypothetical protein
METVIANRIADIQAGCRPRHRPMRAPDSTMRVEMGGGSWSVSPPARAAVPRVV